MQMPSVRPLTALLTGVLVLSPIAPMAAQRPERPKTVPLAAALNTPGRVRMASEQVARGLRVPAGFRVSVFAAGLGNPRTMEVSDDGGVYVARPDSGDVILLRDADGDGRADGEPVKVVTDLPVVHGVGIHEGRMYLATVKQLLVADMLPDGRLGTPRVIVDDLPDGGQHPNRTLNFGPDGYMYLHVGSSCNACAETNPEHATIIRIKPDGTERGVFARGLRNTLAYDWHPRTRDLWGWDMGSDWRGDNLPREELNRIVNGTHYGWPYCHGDRLPDELLASDPKWSSKAEFCARTAAPVLTYTAHSAPLEMKFYTDSMFPAEYRNGAFVTLRGSWNRRPASGYKVVRVRFDADGQPVAVEDFLTSFLTSDGRGYTARIVGLEYLPDGSMLVGDDTNGLIYRVSYGAARAPRVSK